MFPPAKDSAQVMTGVDKTQQHLEEKKLQMWTLWMWTLWMQTYDEEKKIYPWWGK